MIVALLKGFTTVTEFPRARWGWEPIYDTSSLWYVTYNVYAGVYVLFGLLFVLSALTAAALNSWVRALSRGT